MPAAHDVVAFIRRERGSVGGWKLQKLLYYAQAWSLVWDGEELFPEPIEAWIDGPAVRAVFGREKRGQAGGDPDALSEEQRRTVQEVLRVYARHTGDWLGALTHREAPWIDARGDLPPKVSSRTPITCDALRAFYGQAGITTKRIPESYVRGLRLLVSLPDDEVSALMNHDVSVSGDAAIAWLDGTGSDPWRASSG